MPSNVLELRSAHGAMMRNPFIAVATLLGLAVSAPAQFTIAGNFGRHLHISARLGDDHHPEARRAEGRFREPAFVRAGDRGHWQTICAPEWLPGYWREECVPPVFGWVRDACGHAHWQIVQPGCERRVWVPGHYEETTRRVWVDC